MNGHRSSGLFLSLNTQGFSESISPVLSPQGHQSVHLPALSASYHPSLHERKNTEFIKAGLVTFLKEPDRWAEADGNCIFFHSALRYSSWSGEPVVSEGFFVKCSQVTSSWYVFSLQLDSKECEDKGSFLFLYSGFLCLSFSSILQHHHTQRKPHAWLIHHTSC